MYLCDFICINADNIPWTYRDTGVYKGIHDDWWMILGGHSSQYIRGRHSNYIMGVPIVAMIPTLLFLWFGWNQPLVDSLDISARFREGHWFRTWHGTPVKIFGRFGHSRKWWPMRNLCQHHPMISNVKIRGSNKPNSTHSWHHLILYFPQDQGFYRILPNIPYYIIPIIWDC